MSPVLPFLVIRVQMYMMCLKRLSVGEKHKQGPPFNSMNPSQSLQDFFEIGCHASLTLSNKDTQNTVQLFKASWPLLSPSQIK